jgi:hypothetical protein
MYGHPTAASITSFSILHLSLLPFRPAHVIIFTLSTPARYNIHPCCGTGNQRDELLLRQAVETALGGLKPAVRLRGQVCLRRQMLGGKPTTEDSQEARWILPSLMSMLRISHSWVLPTGSVSCWRSWTRTNSTSTSARLMTSKPGERAR